MVIKKAIQTEKIIKQGNKMLSNIELTKNARNLLSEGIKDDLRTGISWLSDLRICVGNLNVIIKKMEKHYESDKINKK